MKWAVSLLLFVVGFVVSYMGVARTELLVGEREAIMWRSVVIGLVVSIVYFGLYAWFVNRRNGRNNEPRG